MSKNNIRFHGLEKCVQQWRDALVNEFGHELKKDVYIIKDNRNGDRHCVDFELTDKDRSILQENLWHRKDNDMLWNRRIGYTMI